MVVGDENKATSLCCCFTKRFQKQSTTLQMDAAQQKDANQQKKPQGWKAMPFVLGNETCERLASFGLGANFMVYFMKIYHMDQVSAANVLNIWGGITNFAPLFGAFIADAFVGRFRTIAFASFSSLLGMATITLTAWLPGLHPPQCLADHCESPTGTQLAFLFVGLGFLSIGTGGVRPCSVPFGVDQFDPATEQGKKGISSFYNWYYTSFTLVLVISSTLAVYIQDSISWVLGFAIPTLFMLSAIVLFFAGSRIFVYEKVQGSIFSGIGQVFVAAYRKRKLKVPAYGEVDDGVFYDPPVKDQNVLLKLPLTDQCRFLNKGAIIEKNDLTHDGGCANPWRLCSIQQIEEVKCLFKIVPIAISGLLSLTSVTQIGIFTVSQALTMDRHAGNRFQIPAGSVGVFPMLTVAIWLPFYDRIIVPSIRKITKHESGITLLQRLGIGIVFSIIAMAISGFVERERRAQANSNPNSAPMSVLWLAPQLVVMGLCEAFNFTGQIEFYNKESPQNMKSIANSFFTSAFAGANYLSTLVIIIVHKSTRTQDHPDWLTNNLNAGRLDYFYFLLAGIGILNLVYFMFCAHHYHYKSPVIVEDENYNDVELSKFN